MAPGTDRFNRSGSRGGIAASSANSKSREKGWNFVSVIKGGGGAKERGEANSEETEEDGDQASSDQERPLGGLIKGG